MERRGAFQSRELVIDCLTFGNNVGNASPIFLILITGQDSVICQINCKPHHVQCWVSYYLWPRQFTFRDWAGGGKGCSWRSLADLSLCALDSVSILSNPSSLPSTYQKSVASCLSFDNHDISRPCQISSGGTKLLQLRTTGIETLLCSILQGTPRS